MLVGILAGLVGTYFEQAVHLVSETRTDWLKSEIGSFLPLWLAAFLISAFLAFIGYFLVHRFAPEAAGSGIPEIEGAMDGMRPVRWWRVLPVKFLAAWARWAQVWCSAAKVLQYKWAAPLGG